MIHCDQQLTATGPAANIPEVTSPARSTLRSAIWWPALFWATILGGPATVEAGLVLGSTFQESLADHAAFPPYGTSTLYTAGATVGPGRELSTFLHLSYAPNTVEAYADLDANSLQVGFQFHQNPYITGLNDIDQYIFNFSGLQFVPGQVLIGLTVLSSDRSKMEAPPSISIFNTSSGVNLQLIVDGYLLGPNFAPNNLNDDSVTFGFITAATVPEPASLWLLGLGLVGLAIGRRNQRSARKGRSE